MARAADTADTGSVVPQGALAKMPVKEVTIFKDGHAFVLHEGQVPTDEQGSVHLDYLPTPVIGTFWPYSADANIKLESVTAGKQRVRIQRTALSVREMLEGNIGAMAFIREGTQPPYAATIVTIPARSGQELEATSAADSGPLLPEKGQVIVLKTAEGYKVVNIADITQVTFPEIPQPKVEIEELRNLLSLRLAWPENKPAASAKVGMVYLQKGIRWIPHYKIEVDGEGQAQVRLQATVLNELTDLENVTANLVIGVPSFYFKDTADPISLGQTVAQLSQYFQTDSQMAFGLSNSMMTQVPRMGEVRNPRGGQPAGQPIDLGPDVANTGGAEDLYIFTVQGLSLKKGERMVLPVVEFTLPYKDVFTLEMGVAPPVEVRRHFNNTQQEELARLYAQPKVQHQLRLTNQSGHPLTTAPAIVSRGGRLLGQGLMTYTAAGASTDLAMTTAVDVAVRKEDLETKRSPNAANLAGQPYDRIDLAGTITLTSYRKAPTDVEVVRYVLGTAESPDKTARADRVNLAGESWQGSAAYPSWWVWYNWPYWWHRLNPVSRIRWTVRLEPGEQVDLSYNWHYYWRD
jgi:hypothetical protein